MFNKFRCRASKINLICASLIFLSLNPNAVLASGHSPVRQQPGGYEQVQPVFIPGSEQDIHNTTPSQVDEFTSQTRSSNCIEDKGFTYCVGDKVFNNYDNASLATISGIYQSGEVTIKYDDSSKHFNWPTNLLAVTFGCSPKSKDHCVNTKVITDSGYSAVIVGIYHSDKVAIKYDQKFSGYFSNWPTDKLALAE